MIRSIPFAKMTIQRQIGLFGLKALPALAFLGLVLAAPLDCVAAETAGDHAFHWFHRVEVGADLACRLWHDLGPPLTWKETVAGRYACHVIEHPFAWLLEHKPGTWEQYEPEFILKSEEHIKENSKKETEPLLPQSLRAWVGRVIYGERQSDVLDAPHTRPINVPNKKGWDFPYIYSEPEKPNLSQLCRDYFKSPRLNAFGSGSVAPSAGSERVNYLNLSAERWFHEACMREQARWLKLMQAP